MQFPSPSTMLSWVVSGDSAGPAAGAALAQDAEKETEGPTNGQPAPAQAPTEYASPRDTLRTFLDNIERLETERDDDHAWQPQL